MGIPLGFLIGCYNKDMRKEQKVQIDNHISHLIEQGKQKFIICPFGELGQYIKEILNEKYSIDEYLIIDNYRKEDGVIASEDLGQCGIDSDAVAIICVSYPEIANGYRSALEKVMDEEHITEVFDRNKVDTSEIDKEIRIKANRLIESIATDRGAFYFFFTGPIGDVLAVASLLNHIKVLHGVSRLVLVTAKKYKNFENMFDAIDEIRPLNGEECAVLMGGANKYCNIIGGNYIVGNWAYLNKVWKLYNNRLDPFKLAVLQIPQECKPTGVSKKYLESISISDDNKILIAPFANTFDNQPKEFWKSIVKKLKDKGYTVFCNVFKTEQEIEGTIRYEESLDKAFEFTFSCRAVITNRSGFSDLIGFNDRVRHIVINPSEDRMKYEDISIYGSKMIENVVMLEDWTKLVDIVVGLAT